MAAIVSIVGGMLTMLAVVVGAVLWLGSMKTGLDDLEVQVVSLRSEMKTEITELRQDVKPMREDRWTASDQREWEREEFADMKQRVRALELQLGGEEP